MAIQVLDLKRTGAATFKVGNNAVSSDAWYRFSLIALGTLVVLMIVAVKSRSAVEFWSDPLLLAYAFFITTFQLSRLVSAMFYRYSYNLVVPAELQKNPQLYEPKVTFVIPSKNEEDAIERTIRKCYEADYPREKIEVIAINDGSTDRTGEIMESLKADYPHLIVVNWEENRGKRQGMAEGFRQATGEIVVQLDSDSFISPETFRHLILPFANPEIGAVCAHADPQNSDANLLTKMQAAYYFMSFRILKAAESTYHTVFCCSGCSSAYRRSIVMPIMDQWLAETFLGLPCTWGDDRALTTWVLKQGYRTIYTTDAQAYTIVPEGLRQFIKQQIRWKKSWLINFVFTGKFIFKKDPFVALTYFFPLALVTFLTPFMAARAMLYNPMIRDIVPVYYIFGLVLIMSLFVIFYRYSDRGNRYWPYLYLWSLFNVFFLAYLLIYALLTIQNRKWGTR